MDSVDIELRDLDEEELQKINQFMLSGYSCVLGPSDINGQKTPCFNWFNREEVVYRREQCLEIIQRLYAHYSSNGFIHKDNKSIGKPSKNPWNRDIHKRREGIKYFWKTSSKITAFAFREECHLITISNLFVSLVIGIEKSYIRNMFSHAWNRDTYPIVACPELGIMGRRSDVCSVCHVHSKELALMFRDSLQKNTIEDWTSQIKSPISIT
ncbi:Putative LOC582807, partial [Caligus rogercresseyi]